MIAGTIGAVISVMVNLSTAAAPAVAQPAFDEIAASVGLDFVHQNGMTGQYFFSEMMGPGVAFLDYDGDGDLDVYLVQGGPLGGAAAAEKPSDRLYRNDLRDGKLRFTDVTDESGVGVTTEYGMGVATGDVDGDGRVDLYVVNFGDNRLLRNESTGGKARFRDVTEAWGAGDSRWSVSASFADLDRDGRQDLFVANYVNFALAVHKPCRNYTGAPDYCSPLAYAAEGDRLLLNVGGRFQTATSAAGLDQAFGAGLGVIAADLDGDGWSDLYVANDQSANQMWLNQGVGADGRLMFVDESLLGGTAVNADGRPEAGMGIAAGDVDEDGDVDLLVSHLIRETHTLYLNQGGGFFDDATAESGLALPSWDATGFGAVWIDYDSDGRLDLAVANGAVKHLEHLVRAGDLFPLHEPNQLFRNLGPAKPGGVARFEDVSKQAGEAFALSEVSRGLALGDVDNDGDSDLLVGNNRGPVRLLLNRTKPAGPWFGLRLVTESGVDALGAQVRIVRAGAPALHRRVHTDGSYASASDPRILVGLGGVGSGVSGKVERVEVTWPDGSRETLPAPELGVYTTLRQGSGEALSGKALLVP